MTSSVRFRFSTAMEDDGGGDENDSIYREIFGSDDDEERPQAAEKPKPPSSAAVVFRPKQRQPERKEAGGLLRAEKLRIKEMRIAPKEVDRAGGDGDAKFVIFTGAAVGTARMKWKGVLPKPDMLHEYSVLYKIETDAYDPGRQIAHVLKVYSARRAPLDREILSLILQKVPKLDAFTARRVADRISIDTMRNLAAFLRECGNEKWLKAAESETRYFQDWYIEELSPPYEPESLKYVPTECLCALARAAIAEPWKLCFWWMTGSPLLEELTAEQAKALAQKFGAEFPDSARIAAAAYCGHPFADARGRGDSYVDIDWFRSEKAPRGALQACLKHKVARVVTPADLAVPAQVYCVGDLECEKAVAELIVRAVTRPERPGEVKMRPRSAWWPDCDRNAPRPNDEQRAAIEAALHTRLGVICGKPGTGKTTMVMKSLFSAFWRGQCVGVSFTGMSADNQRKVAGFGVTAHRVVHEWRRAGCGRAEHAFSGRTVLVVDEASAMSMRIFHATLLALSPSIARIYVFADPRQMAPPDGGPSFLEALVRRYGGTAAATAAPGDPKIVSELTISMRVSDASGAFLRDQDRICEHRVDDGFEWSPDPAAKHPVVFLQRGSSAAENVRIIRDALRAAGVDPDSGRAQIMVRTNETRVAVARCWYEASEIGQKALASGRPYDEHEFSVGERVMFLRNANAQYRPRGSMFTSSKFMNGTCGTIAEIFDEILDNEKKLPPRQVRDTRERKQDASLRRWMRLEPGDLHVLLDNYGKQKITRVPPVTIDKMQGLEADYAVVLLVKAVKKLGSKGMYSACSRGKLGCFVVADFDPAIDPASGRCPSRDFADTVMASAGVEPKTDFWLRFPEYEKIKDAIRVDPEACLYYANREKGDGGGDDEEEKGPRRQQPQNKKKRRIKSVLEIAAEKQKKLKRS